MMARSAANIKQSDLVRYMKAWNTAGLPGPKVEIRPDGTVIIAAASGSQEGSNPCDRLLD